MNRIRRINGTFRNTLLTAASVVALAAGGLAHAVDEMVVTAPRAAAEAVALTRDVDAAVAEARERLNDEIRRDLGTDSGARLLVSGLDRDSRG